MKKIIYSALLLGALGFQSCSDVLEVEPRDIIDEEKAFESIADIEQGAIGVYNAMSGSNLIDISSRMGDNLRRSNENRGQGVQTHNWTYTAGQGEVEGIWINHYRVIARANRVLAAIERLNASGTVPESEVTNAIKGELLAIRAMTHFDLWRVYSEKYNQQSKAVPYLTLEDTDGNGRPDGLDVFFLPSRPTTQDFFGQLQADLTAAAALVPADFTDVTRLNATAVKALRARVALYQEDWAKAIEFSTAALEDVGLESAEDFANIWKDETNNGVIFKLKRVSGEFAVGTLFQDMNGDVFFHPSNDIISLYDQTNDVRFGRTIMVEDRGDKDPQLVNKYPGIAGLPRLNDIKIFRSAEMLLIRAEARAKSNQLALANEDLNSLRENRIAEHTEQSYATEDAFMAQLLTERRRELSFEGHRWFDIKRNGLGVSRTDDDCHLNCTLEAGSLKFAFPIPQSEIFANSNIDQNPGYN